MAQSIEAYFLMNFAVDTALIWIIARANGCAHWGRILLCGALAGSYAAAVRIFFPELEHPFLQVLLLLFGSILIVGEPELLRWSTAALELFSAAMLLGGFLVLTQGCLNFCAAFAAGIFLTARVFVLRHQRRCTWEVRVCVVLNGKSESFRALIDSGNRLREPLSGKPVLIAESALLNGLLSRQEGRRVSFRQVAYGGLGGCGTIRCFLPDAILIQRERGPIRAPEAWIALYPGKIPGPTRALAPPSFSIIPGRP